MPKPFLSEFRRRALDLVESGRTVRDVAAVLGIAESCLYRWKTLDQIERGLRQPTAAAVESKALAAAQARIADLECEVKILRKAAAAVEQVVPPKVRFALIEELAADGVPVDRACRALGVSRAGYYEARGRPPSVRTIRHAYLSDLIATVHSASRETYGARRVRAELVHGHGVTVGTNTVAMLMRRHGLVGLPRHRRGKRSPAIATGTDLVKGYFGRDAPNQLWVTDITGHPTPWIPAIVATPTGGVDDGWSDLQRRTA